MERNSLPVKESEENERGRYQAFVCPAEDSASRCREWKEQRENRLEWCDLLEDMYQGMNYTVLLCRKLWCELMIPLDLELKTSGFLWCFYYYRHESVVKKCCSIRMDVKLNKDNEIRETKLSEMVWGHSRASTSVRIHLPLADLATDFRHLYGSKACWIG